jgi:hypothetical protein
MDDRIMTSSGWVCEKCGNHWGEPHQGGCYRCKEIAEEEAAATAILRDQFAMAALTGMLTGAIIPEDQGIFLARHAYWMADSMLEARK